MATPRKWKRPWRGDQHSGIPPALEAHFAAHNRQVIYMALAALGGAVAFWALLYACLYWVVLVLTVAVGGIDAQVSPLFKEGFIVSAVVLCALVFIAQSAGPRRPPRDTKLFAEHLADVILMVPRMTLFVWSVLRAYQFLDRDEKRLAWQLLQRIEKERKISLSTVPLDIPDARKQEKILIALQLVELIDLHPAENDILLHLRDDKARALCQRKVKLQPEAPSE